jgi:sulfatase maturation enzyme AslB (radical SAM superfamily)
MMFARDNACNTVILTGDGEPLMNHGFLEDFGEWNNSSNKPFRWIEIQTSGVGLDDEKLRFLRNSVGVSAISLSLSNMFDSESNCEINGTPEKLKVDIDKICLEIKRYDFNLRLSLNMNSVYNEIPVEKLFGRAHSLGADQITFRKLYTSGDENQPQNIWIVKHEYTNFSKLNDYILSKGRELEMLPFGALRYSVHGMSVVIDNDCMSTDTKRVLKYLILRPDCKLYTKWDDKGSKLF